MKPIEIRQSDYDKLASKNKNIKSILDAGIKAGILVIKKENETSIIQPEETILDLTVPDYFQFDARKLVLAGADRNFPDYNPKELVTLARSCGCNGISIEMVANDRYFTIGADKVRKPYLDLLKECRKQNMTLFVCIWNDWAPVKYIKSHAEKFLSYVVEGGPPGVIVQPVGETHTSEGRAFESRAKSQLKKDSFLICYNGNGGQPRSKPSGWDYLAYHSPGSSDRCDAPSGSIEITDHGQKIRWIGFVDAGKVEAVARNARKRGAGFGFYLYVGMSDNGSPKSFPLSKLKQAWTTMANVYKQ